MNQNVGEVQLRQIKFQAQYTVISFQLIHIFMIIAIITITILSLLNNQDSEQVILWCWIELILITYHLLQLIYEICNQLYCINKLFPNPQLLIQEDLSRFFIYFYTRKQSSNIFFFCNDLYIYGLFFSVNFIFRETKRKIPGTLHWSTCSDDDGEYSCQVYDYETIPPRYHGPYLIALANLNVTFFSLGCFYLCFRPFFSLVCTEQNTLKQRQQEYKYNDSVQFIKKQSQIICILFTLYYITRIIHSSINIYDQDINQTLLYSIYANIFYSSMMLTVLISILILIQLKFNSNNGNNYPFITVFDFIDYIIHQNNYLSYYFWFMLIASFIFTCYGVNKFKWEKLDTIVNYQNYVVADLIVAQIVLIFFMIFKYIPLQILSTCGCRCGNVINQICNYEDNIINIQYINQNQIMQQNLTNFQDVQIIQNQKKQAKIIYKRRILFKWNKQFQKFYIHFQKVNPFQHPIKPINKQNHLKMYSNLNSKIIKFWKKKTNKNLINIKKRRINFMINLRKTNKKQVNKKNNKTIKQEIKFIDQQYLGECIICLETFQIINKTKIIIRLNCFGHHIFHSDCIKKWLKYNKKCPICSSDKIKVSFN